MSKVLRIDSCTAVRQVARAADLSVARMPGRCCEHQSSMVRQAMMARLAVEPYLPISACQCPYVSLQPTHAVVVACTPQDLSMWPACCQESHA